jgi:hypothetical protein
MAEELGKIEKLDIEQFGLRKLYVVPLIFLKIIRKSWKDTGVRSMSRLLIKKPRWAKSSGFITNRCLLVVKKDLRLWKESIL